MDLEERRKAIQARGPVVGEPKEWTREELLEALRELHSAAGSVYSEMSGTEQWPRAHRHIEGLVEPMKKSACIERGREYLPPPAELKE